VIQYRYEWEYVSYRLHLSAVPNNVSFYKEKYMNRFIAIVALVIAPLYFVMHFVLFLLANTGVR